MRREQVVSVAAVAVLVLTVVIAWQVGAVRTDRAAVADRADDLAPVTERQAPADYDGDGTRDDADACPTRPETANGFQDGDGCPDVVATTGAS